MRRGQRRPLLPRSRWESLRRSWDRGAKAMFPRLHGTLSCLARKERCVKGARLFHGLAVSPWRIDTIRHGRGREGEGGRSANRSTGSRRSRHRDLVAASSSPYYPSYRADLSADGVHC